MERRSLPKDQAAELGRHHRETEYPDRSLPNVLCSSAYLQMLLETGIIIYIIKKETVKKKNEVKIANINQITYNKLTFFTTANLSGA